MVKRKEVILLGMKKKPITLILLVKIPTTILSIYDEFTNQVNLNTCVKFGIFHTYYIIKSFQ